MTVKQPYYNKLKDKIFKIHPFFIEKNEGLTTYISSLIYELQGLDSRVNKTQSNILQTIISIMEHFYDDSFAPDPDLNIIRREWLNCMNLVDKVSEHGDKNEYL